VDAGQHGVQRGRCRDGGGPHLGPVLPCRPAPVCAAPHAGRRDRGGRGDGPGREVQAGAPARALAGPAAGPDPDPADRGGHRAARPRAVQPRRRHGPAVGSHDRHHHRAGPGRPPCRPARAGRRYRGRTGNRGPEGGRRRAGRARSPADAHRGGSAPAGPDRRGGPAGRAVPDHRPAAGGPGRGPDPGRPAARRLRAGAYPGSRSGGQRLPVLPVHQKRSFIPNGPWCLPPPRRRLLPRRTEA
jgi:translation initiation factor IF-2